MGDFSSQFQISIPTTAADFFFFFLDFANTGSHARIKCILRFA